ncbi:MAG: disulfide bond formation protein B, partial [Candidatus Pelagibacter sp. TMED253]
MIYIEKNWSLVLFCISILTLGSALIAEHFFNLAPCDMCLKQRHPYYALIVLVVLFYLFKKNNHILLLLLVELLILYGLFYAIWHVGVEQNI